MLLIIEVCFSCASKLVWVNLFICTCLVELNKVIYFMRSVNLFVIVHNGLFKL